MRAYLPVNEIVIGELVLTYSKDSGDEIGRFCLVLRTKTFLFGKSSWDAMKHGRLLTSLVFLAFFSHSTKYETSMSIQF